MAILEAAPAPRVRDLAIRGRSDVVSAGSLARRMALEAGFGHRRAREVAIVVCELASNMVRHAGGGALRLETATEGPRPLLSVSARDSGPPIVDLAMAVIDGCDGGGPIDPALLLRRGGLGTGLGAIIRLADLFEYRATLEGKDIRARLLG
ncbi:MAG TPA: ATP-binding protein [Thermoanaerobaculia bacterium]|jgi:anti-sigma regulatory factor (Ser/Thr protein kinase)|nr:ATP-binding protein [Thermoanaerobaculia bacterium]